MFRRQVWFLLLLLLLYWRMTPFYFKTISVFSGDGHKMAHCRIVIQYVWNRYVWSGKSVRDKKISVRHLWKKEVAHSIHLTLAKSCHPYCIFFFHNDYSFNSAGYSAKWISDTRFLWFPKLIINGETMLMRVC